MPELGYQAGMSRTVGVFVQPMMELRGDRKREGRQPEREHQPHGRKAAGTALVLRCHPEFQTVLTIRQVFNNSSTIQERPWERVHNPLEDIRDGRWTLRRILRLLLQRLEVFEQFPAVTGCPAHPDKGPGHEDTLLDRPAGG
jgi:hypothetical protein